MKTWTKLFVVLIGLIAGASQATAQTVPYYVEGTFTGNLLDLSAVVQVSDSTWARWNSTSP